VNDLIHGLYPEAITIGEDESVFLFIFQYEFIRHISGGDRFCRFIEKLL
jgi:hypothetical protein